MFVRLRLPLFEPLMSVVESFFPYSVPFRLFISSFFSHGIHSLFLFFFFSVTVVFCHLHQTPVLLFFFFSISLMQYMAFFFFSSHHRLFRNSFFWFSFFFFLSSIAYACLDHDTPVFFFFFILYFYFPPQKKMELMCALFFFPMYYYQIITLDGQSMLLLFFFFPHLDDVSYKRSCLSAGKRGNGEREKKNGRAFSLSFFFFVVGALAASLRSVQNRSEPLDIKKKKSAHTHNS